LKIKIPPGSSDGEVISLSGEAHQEPGLSTGDVVIRISMTPHSLFKRRGSNLYLTHEISFIESLRGFQFSLITPDKRTLKVKSDPKGQIVLTGDVKEVKGEGMPLSGNPAKKGNLFIKLAVKQPNKTFLTPEQAKDLSQVFGEPPVLAGSFDAVVFATDMTPSTQPNFDFSNEEVRRESESTFKGKRRKEEPQGQTCQQM